MKLSPFRMFASNWSGDLRWIDPMHWTNLPENRCLNWLSPFDSVAYILSCRDTIQNGNFPGWGDLFRLVRRLSSNAPKYASANRRMVLRTILDILPSIYQPHRFEQMLGPPRRRPPSQTISNRHQPFYHCNVMDYIQDKRENHSITQLYGTKWQTSIIKELYTVLNQSWAVYR